MFVRKTEYVNASAGTDIGSGLFSQIEWETDMHICKFIGEVITATEKEERESRQEGGYMIEINANQFYDCFRKRSVCKASMANCYLSIVHRLSGAPGVANSKLHISRKGGSVQVRLVCTSVIPANTEILYDPVIV